MAKCVRCGASKPRALFLDELGTERKQCGPCRAKGRRYFKNYAQANPEKVAGYQDKHRNGDKRESYLATRRANRQKRLKVSPKSLKAADRRARQARAAARVAETAARRAAELKATPAWADRQAMRRVYRKAREHKRLTGEPATVDHIVPLKGRGVCGLHVVDNLRIVLGPYNSRKGNKAWPGMPEAEDETRQVPDLSTTMLPCPPKAKS